MKEKHTAGNDAAPQKETLQSVKEIHASGGRQIPLPAEISEPLPESAPDTEIAERKRRLIKILRANDFLLAPGIVGKSTLAIAKMRRGKLVWRIPGRTGGDLPDHPDTIAMLQAEKALNTETNKIARRQHLVLLNSNKRGTTAKKLAADATELKVLRMWKAINLPERNRASAIAKKIGITPYHVRRIVKKSKKRT